MIPKPSENIKNQEQVKKQPSPSPAPDINRAYNYSPLKISCRDVVRVISLWGQR
jgi:hypothetical protein